MRNVGLDTDHSQVALEIKKLCIMKQYNDINTENIQSLGQRIDQANDNTIEQSLNILNIGQRLSKRL